MSLAKRVVISIVVLSAMLVLIPSKGVDLVAGRDAGVSARSSIFTSSNSMNVSVTPSSVNPGTSITISLSDFSYGQSGSITFGRDSTSTEITTFSIPFSGNFTTNWKVPAETQPGNYPIKAVLDGTTAQSNTFVGYLSNFFQRLFSSSSSTTSSSAQATLTVLGTGSGNSTPTTTPVTTATATTTPVSTPASTPTPSPSPTAVTITANSITPGTMRLTSTFNSIGIELFFTHDSNANASANLEFKRASDSTWRQGLALWRTDDGSTTPGPAFYGSAVQLDAGTPYDIRVTLVDPDGVDGHTVITGNAQTRAEDIPSANSLSPTYFVSPTGSDKNAGSSPSAAWQTLDQALKSAPAGAVVQVAPGSYAPPTTERKDPITLLAQQPAVNDAQSVINAGQHSVIEPQSFTSPNTGAWTRVSLTGPATGKSFSVWKWTAPIGKANRMAFASSRSDTPQRVAAWDLKSGTYQRYTMSTPAGWAEVLYVNDTYNYGFAAFGNDVYLRLPGDRNPNDSFVWVYQASGNDGAMVFDGANTRLSGFEIRMVDTNIMWTANDGVFDHNLVYSAIVSYRSSGDAPAISPTDDVVQYNRMIDTGLWSTDSSNPGIPWLFVKQQIFINGQSTNWRRVGADAEIHAVQTYANGANRLVVRHNTIDGYFNAVGGSGGGSIDRYDKYGYDISDNVISHIPDDVFEADFGAINWRVWDNRIDDASSILSTGPARYGPIYLFRNQVWEISSDGVAPDHTGNRGINPKIFKYSGSSKPIARVYVLQNTFWTDADNANGALQAAGGGNDSEAFYLRNNIVAMTRYAFSVSHGESSKWDEDYDYFYSSDASRGLEYNGKNFTSVKDYQSASKQGAHTNVGDTSGAFRTAPALRNPRNGDLSLAPGSPQIDAGVPIPNISDLPGVNYSGSAPDLGAIETP